ncbi:MAG: phosphatidylglycerol---prolipoprotein diacylglyceryl transferase [Chloroflexota bacterium]|jgi:phosphatidylglycerol:prolipoprotein diacylglycerol transferase|nr:phosphatidylglycerol---prolipoprotein diacylglyceryl transferase [Chloroflexota bacterium]
MECALPTCLKIGIDPVAFTVGGFALYWYGLLVAIGFVVAIRLATNEAERRGLDGDQVLSATLVASLFGLLFARVAWVLQYQPGWYVDGKHLGEALSLWQGGLSLTGGIAGGVLGAWLYTNRYNLPTLAVLDVGALVAPLGVALGKVGNIINGDIAGLQTTNFGVEYTNVSNRLLAPDTVGKTQHPIAIYEVLYNLALFGVLYYLWRRGLLRRGQVAGIYLVGYAAGQLVIGAFRLAPTGVAGLRVVQLTALPAAAAGLWLVLRVRGRVLSPKPAP